MTKLEISLLQDSFFLLDAAWVKSRALLQDSMSEVSALLFFFEPVLEQRMSSTVPLLPAVILMFFHSNLHRAIWRLHTKAIAAVA